MTRKTTSKKKNNRSLFYRISAWLHLWLGLISGIVVVIVCITGITWSFKDEITDILYPHLRVKEQVSQSMKSPALLYQKAKEIYPDKEPSFIWRPTGKAVMVGYEKRNAGHVLFLHPYTGAVLQKPTFEDQFDFFEWTLKGHRFLWFPSEFGRPLVNYSTLVFFITLLTGLVLWWPQKWTKAMKKQSFSIKWNAKIKRLNYDLHNVLGFYAMLFLLIIAMTGMYYGLPWFSKLMYRATSLGKAPIERRPSLNNTAPYDPSKLQDALSIAWKDASSKAMAKGYYCSVPQDSTGVISLFMYTADRKFYNLQNFSYDRSSGKEIPNPSPHAQSFQDADFPVKVQKLNYDLHIGSALGGIYGRIFYFLITLIGGSLPITGFLVWWFKKKKAK